MKPDFTAEFKPNDRRPDEPILVGRGQSQARISINEALKLIHQLQQSVAAAQLENYEGQHKALTQLINRSKL